MPETLNCYLISSIMGEGYNFHFSEKDLGKFKVKLVIDDAPNLKTLYISAENVSHLSIANCPLLENVYIHPNSIINEMKEIRLDNLTLLSKIHKVYFKEDGSIDPGYYVKIYHCIDAMVLYVGTNCYITNVPKFSGGQADSTVPAVPLASGYSSRLEEVISDKKVDAVGESRSTALGPVSRAEQSRAEQSRAEQSRAEQNSAVPG